jgi:asparagine synthase (glutamine-hydrolysing)
MCGLAGFLTESGSPTDALARRASDMADRIAHRGPDDAGTWVDAAAGIALGHRRLAVLDLSPAGHQPMLSACGRYVIAFNGEIYNHLELRRDLGPRTGSWRGHSDTETLLAYIAAKGLRAALQSCVGMFAFALWDRERQQLSLARDRLGEKPLYYGWQGRTFLFGSELRALQAHPAFRAEINRDALASFLRLGYIPAPNSIFSGIQKLQPGCYVRVDHRVRDASEERYWSLADAARIGEEEPFLGSDEAGIVTLEKELSRAIKGQSVADVPVGTLLSGGIDSSMVTALMQAHSSRPIKTFTVGFSERQHNEAAHAAAVAKHLGTEHNEVILSPKDALRITPDLPHIYDEPFADPSQLPTQLVMRVARQSVTVALSGDGGDEFFGGYNRYRFLPSISRGLASVPQPIRQALGRSLQSLTTHQWDRLLRPVAALVRVSQIGEKIHKLASRMRTVNDPYDLFVSVVSQWDRPERVVSGAREPSSIILDRTAWPQLADPVAQYMAVDALSYLPGDILTKVDRAAMAVSLETRAPFLDHRVVEFAWRLPMRFKLRRGVGKWVLRRVLERYVPSELFERPKMGFGVPLDDWLRGPLRPWAEDLLNVSTLRAQGYFDTGIVGQTWQAHLNGASNGTRLWSVLMFQAWLSTVKRQVAVEPVA